jgi:hypothetical protein
MLEKYFSAPKTLERLRGGPSGPHIDGFATRLEQDGYSHASAVRYLRAAAHLGRFLQPTGDTLVHVNSIALEAFRRHLPRCRCPLSNGGRVNHHVHFGAKRFHAYLVQTGICTSAPVPPPHRGTTGRLFSRLVPEAPRCRRTNAQTLLPRRNRPTHHAR